jgi:NADPH:quinone reductase-like Zn-dependent oxidoreductase
VIDYHAGRVSDQLDEPVDAVLDLVGGSALEDAPRQVREGSTRIASVIDPEKVLELGGTYVFVRPDRPTLDALAELVKQGKLRVLVSGRYALDQVADAYQALEKGAGPGKVVITI